MWREPKVVWRRGVCGGHPLGEYLSGCYYMVISGGERKHRGWVDSGQSPSLLYNSSFYKFNAVGKKKFVQLNDTISITYINVSIYTVAWIWKNQTSSNLRLKNLSQLVICHQLRQKTHDLNPRFSKGQDQLEGKKVRDKKKPKNNLWGSMSQKERTKTRSHQCLVT